MWSRSEEEERPATGLNAESDDRKLHRLWEKYLDSVPEISSTTNLTGEAERNAESYQDDEGLNHCGAGGERSARFSFESTRSILTESSDDTITPKRMG